MGKIIKCINVVVMSMERINRDGRTSLVAQTVKNPLAIWETWVGKIPWRRVWQPTPVFFPGGSPWTEEPGGLQSMRLKRVWHDWATKHTVAQFDGRESGWTPGVGDGQRGLECCDSWGCKEMDTTERLNWTEVWVCFLCLWIYLYSVSNFICIIFLIPHINNIIFV